MLKGLFGRTSTASAVPAPASLPPGWEIIMNGAQPNYFHPGTGKLQTVFPQPERDPEPKRELPAGWREEKRHNSWEKWVEYVNILDPRARNERLFPTEPAPRPLSPLFKQFTVGDKIMYRSITNPNYVTAEFQPADDAQIAQMWEENSKTDGGQWRGGKRKQSKRKQSKRKQSKRKQSKRKQSKKSH
jgi:hypothetical protein